MPARAPPGRFPATLLTGMCQMTMWHVYWRIHGEQKNEAWCLEHFVNGTHGVSPAMLGYVETTEWPRQGQKWVTTAGFHVSVQVMTVEHFADYQKNKAPAVGRSSLATKLDALESKLEDMNAEHAKDADRLADKL